MQEISAKRLQNKTWLVGEGDAQGIVNTDHTTK